MKIVHISPTYYSPDSVVGGGERYVINVCRALQIAANSSNLPVEQSLIAFSEFASSSKKTNGFPLILIEGKPWQSRSVNAEKLRSFIDFFDIVIIHQCLSEIGLFSAAHARLLSKIVIGFDHGGGEHPLVHHTLQVGKLFNLIAAYSQYGYDNIKSLDVTTEVIPGPVDDEYFTPEVASDLHPSNDQSMIYDVVSLGRILPHKGFDRIVRALPSTTKLTIVGSESDQEYIEYLRHISIGKSVEIVRDLSDDQVLGVLRRARLLVHASTHVDYKGTYYAKPELLGLAPLEALCCGTPAFVSNAGALRELSKLDGCIVFNNDEELVSLLNRHSAGSILWPNRGTIRNSVVHSYGLKQFGINMIESIERTFK